MALHDSSNVREPLIIAVILVFLATLAVVLRFISRKLKGIAYGPDDWSIALGLVKCPPIAILPSIILTLGQFWTYAQLGLQIASMARESQLMQPYR